MHSPGRELAAGSDLWLTAEKVGRWQVGHQPLAGGGESRRPKGVSSPGQGGPKKDRAPEGRQTVAAARAATMSTGHLSPLRGFFFFLALNLGLTPQANHMSPLWGLPSAVPGPHVFPDEPNV
jgi:hypothetical protein